MIGKHIAALAGRRQLAHCACVAIVAVLAIAAGQASATDQDIVNTYGFETNPPNGPPAGFTTTFLGTGQLEGQVNPIGFAQLGTPGQWQRPQGNGASTAVVQTAVVAGGSGQAVKVTRAANDDSRWAIPVNNQGLPDYPNPAPPEPAQPCLCVSWDMLVEQAAGDGLTTFGPFFGVQAFDDDGNPVARLGTLGVDASTGDVIYQAAVTGLVTDTGVQVSRGAGQWNLYQIKFDYSTHEYTGYLNNTALFTEQFVDHALTPGGLNQFSDADISALNIALGSEALTGVAYFDNFWAREGACPIPEPSTLLIVAMGLSLCALTVRRRKRFDA